MLWILNHHKQELLLSLAQKRGTNAAVKDRIGTGTIGILTGINIIGKSYLTQYIYILQVFFLRDKPSRSGKDREREHYHREKDRYYREKHLEQLSFDYEKNYRDRKQDSRLKHPEALRKHEEKKQKDSSRDVRYSREVEKHKREHYEDVKKSSRMDKALKDLRERLIIKRGSSKNVFIVMFNSNGVVFILFLGSKTDDLGRKEKSHRDRKHKEQEVDPLQGEAGQLVKEIISITTEEKRHRNKEKEDDKLTEEERAEQEQRREKLLEAGMLSVSDNFVYI